MSRVDELATGCANLALREKPVYDRGFQRGLEAGLKVAEGMLPAMRLAARKRRRRISLDKKGRIKESEADIQQRIVDYLEAHGWLVFQNRSKAGGRLAAILTKDQSGSPDLFVWGKRILTDLHRLTSGPYPISAHFAVEVKRPGEKLSDAQFAWAGRFCALGFKYIVATDHTDVERALKNAGWA